MSARENVRSAHTEIEKMRGDGRNLKGAKERNEYLTPETPNTTTWAQHFANTFQCRTDMDDDQQMTGDRYLFRIPGNSSSLSPSFYLYYETTSRFVGRGKAALAVSTPLLC